MQFIPVGRVIDPIAHLVGVLGEVVEFLSRTGRLEIPRQGGSQRPFSMQPPQFGHGGEVFPEVEHPEQGAFRQVVADVLEARIADGAAAVRQLVEPVPRRIDIAPLWPSPPEKILAVQMRRQRRAGKT